MTSRILQRIKDDSRSSKLRLVAQQQCFGLAFRCCVGGILLLATTTEVTFTCFAVFKLLLLQLLF